MIKYVVHDILIKNMKEYKLLTVLNKNIFLRELINQNLKEKLKKNKYIIDTLVIGMDGKYRFIVVENTNEEIKWHYLRNPSKNLLDYSAKILKENIKTEKQWAAPKIIKEIIGFYPEFIKSEKDKKAWEVLGKITRDKYLEDAEYLKEKFPNIKKAFEEEQIDFEKLKELIWNFL